jgi:hypothetical protein
LPRTRASLVGHHIIELGRLLLDKTRKEVTREELTSD